ncbi:MAG: PAS domain-containing sensor histidine kinase, partial [Chlorobiaceae bacterium]|nr:PAS domain-containing sensor histidine kinase [Chlorobiaceae bacterium]
MNTQQLLQESERSRLALLSILEDQKRTEGNLRKSEAYNRLLFNLSPIGLALCKMDGSLVDVNPSYAKIIGRTIEETLKLTYWDITPKKYEEQEKRQLKSLEETGSYGPYEKEYIHKDGHLVPVRLQ